MSSSRVGSTSNTQKPTQGTTQKESTVTSPVVPSHVIFKLLAFTLAMVIGPIGCYYLTLNNIFGGNSTYAGATAAITANMVLFGYIIVAFKEDQHELSKGSKERKTK